MTKLSSNGIGCLDVICNSPRIFFAGTTVTENICDWKYMYILVLLNLLHSVLHKNLKSRKLS
jgi:hypothetical protein